MQSNAATDNEFRFGPLFRMAGYALLALSLLDIISVFIPLGFTNPTWEFQIASTLVERSPVPLIGLVLLLVGEKNIRIFQFLSKACLVVGILFLLLIPLVVSSGWRLQTQGSQQVVQQTAQIRAIKELVNKANTSQEISSILTRLNPQAKAPEIKNPQQVKNQLIEKLNDAERKLTVQAGSDSTNVNLIKNMIKTALGALIAGAWFLTIWRKTNKVSSTKKHKNVRGMGNNQPLVNE